MESAQRELINVLLGRALSLGLISKTTHSQAVDLVHSATDLPELFQYPVRLEKEGSEHEHPTNTQ